MIRCKLFVKLKRKKRIVKPIDYTRNLPLVSGEGARSCENKFMEALCTTVGIQDQYNKFETLMKNMLQLLPAKDRGKKEYVNQETKHLLNQRKLLYKGKRTKEISAKITKISKEINRNISHEKKKYRQNTLDNLIKRTGALRKAYKELSDKTEWTANLKSKRGNILTRRPDIIHEATRFYKELYTNDQQNNTSDHIMGRIYNDQNSSGTGTESFLQSEIEYAIITQKNDKSPGSDNIANEVLKSLCIPLLKPLQLLFNNILSVEKTPEQWSKSTITLLHKKGDRSELGNYRPISLMTNLYKIFSKVILNRVTKILDENQPREQAGFRKKYSTMDHIQVVTQVIEKANEYGKTVYMCFIDYQKAFDSLHYDAIWSALLHQGIDVKYVNLIKSVYSKCWAKVRLEREGIEFPIQKGVRQGDPLSPKLFSAVLESVFRNLEWSKKGIKVDGEYLSHLRFADDIVVFAETAIELESMVSELAGQSKKVGLSLNASKTKIITNGENNEVTVENTIIEYVKDYIYLGQLVSFENCTEKETHRRIALAWKKYWGLKEIMKNREINLHIKKKVYEIAILPCLTYGCQTWSLRKEDEEKIAICQRKMERSMLHIKKSDKVKNEIIRMKTKLTDVKQRIRLLKWNWAGHLCRLESTRWTKRVTEWIPLEGKRKQGRQRKRWRDIFTQRCGPDWMQKARDRIVWSDLGEAYAAEATATNSDGKRS